MGAIVLFSDLTTLAASMCGGFESKFNWLFLMKENYKVFMNKVLLFKKSNLKNDIDHKRKVSLN